MGILDFFKKQSKEQPKEKPKYLRERYSPFCVESANNRGYLEDFFDVNNYDPTLNLKIIPNCGHCCNQHSCVVGLHVLKYFRNSNPRSEQEPESKSEPKNPSAVVGNNMDDKPSKLDSRFNKLID